MRTITGPNGNVVLHIEEAIGRRKVWGAQNGSAEFRDTAVEDAIELDTTITQDGIARIFARDYAGRLRYCHDAGRWYQWAGTHWRQDRADVAFQACRRIGRTVTDGGKARDLKEVRKVQFAAGVERFSRGDGAFAVTADRWDQDPWLLGTPGGTVDLCTGVLRAADQAEGITKLAAVAPDPTADCPRWGQFLEETTAKDEALIRFLQQWAGYSLTGVTTEHALAFVFGPGGNGKSVFINVLAGIMADYAITSAMDTFTASRGDKHTTDLAMLRGARLVTASETEEGRPWAEARIKQLTGGDRITARFMRQDNFEFQPQFKLLIVGNHKPALSSVDEATKRRFNMVPFTQKPAKPDPGLEEALRAEWPGILRWMIEGCLDWQKNRLVRPESVKDATATYFADQDLFGQWMDQDCECDPGNDYRQERNVDLFASWRDFATKAGEVAGSQKVFTDKMGMRGYHPKRTMTGRIYIGIRLRKQGGYGSD